AGQGPAQADRVARRRDSGGRAGAGGLRGRAPSGRSPGGRGKKVIGERTMSDVGSVPPPNGRGESGRILVVDDNTGIQELLDVGLSSGGFEVTSASNAAEGIARFLETRPDACLIDVLMPGMDGYELCRRLRELTDVPIIIVSALRNEAEIIKGLDAGADDYVTKPFSVNDLPAP